MKSRDKTRLVHITYKYLDINMLTGRIIWSYGDLSKTWSASFSNM